MNPLRGKAGSALLYDKELITLYIVGRYGLGITEELSALVEKVFDVETKLDQLYRELKASIQRGNIGEVISKIKGLDEDTFFRFLRYCFTLYALGFVDEEEFLNILRTLYKVPELTSKVRRFTKFYVAYKMAELIARGSIRTSREKTLWKNVIAASTGIEKAVPEDLQIAIIAKKLFSVSDQLLRKIFPRLEATFKVRSVEAHGVGLKNEIE